MARKASRRSGGRRKAGGAGVVEAIPLHRAAEERYLNYALSVITARALPDVRDGLKPVQRRIVFKMHEQGIGSTAKFSKCAKVVGDVMGQLHPHGDSAIYDALVRLAQPFAMRMPLIEGSGNFGSLDGDPAAAMRYTECRLQLIAEELLRERGQRTVDSRDNYDGSRQEPVVLPARMPNLLINGSTGIAVAMATNIPPHNPREVLDAVLKLLDKPEISLRMLLRGFKGPDFPTGGLMLADTADLERIYETGQGSVRVRGAWAEGEKARSSRTLVITSVPYAVNKSTLVERIADIVASRKLPPLLDVRDVSAEDVRVELDVKADADAELVMSYLYRHTPLQTNFACNLTTLVPTSTPGVGRPERLGLLALLRHFLDFRLEVETRKLENELRLLEARIHILEGLAIVFDALDEIIAIIRASEGKKDAATKIMARLPLDEEQTEAILELKLYRLARLEILVIREELDGKRARAEEVRAHLADESSRWDLVRSELKVVRDLLAKDPQTKRRTEVLGHIEEPEFRPEDFIVEEDTVVLLSKDGWIRRQKEVKDLSRTKVRQGDEIVVCELCGTRSAFVFFSNHGAAYTARVADLPATTGHGEPIQKRFKLDDGERIVAAFSLDARAIGKIAPQAEGEEPPVHAVAVTSDGQSLRFGLESFSEASTKSGRRYARVAEGAEVIGVEVIEGNETMIAVTEGARAILCPASEISFLNGPGKGVALIKVAGDDRVLGFKASRGERDVLVVETARGARKTIGTGKYGVTGRGGRGREVQKTGRFAIVRTDPPLAPHAES